MQVSLLTLLKTNFWSLKFSLQSIEKLGYKFLTVCTYKKFFFCFFYTNYYENLLPIYAKPFCSMWETAHAF